MENEELIFILNTAELREGGFEGSFNDFAKELEDAGATVSGEYDEDGTPVMTIYGMQETDLHDIMSDFGVDEPERFTAEVETADEFDFDVNIDEEGGTAVADDDDEAVEIVDDDDEEIEIVDDEEEDVPFEHMMPRNVRQRVNERKETKKQFKGTANLSESVTMKIINQVKDAAMMKRIAENSRSLYETATYVAPLPFNGVKVDGLEINNMSESEMKSVIAKTKASFKKGVAKYKGLNESQSEVKGDYEKALKRQKKLITLLENAYSFRSGKMFEDMDLGSETQNTDTQQPQDNGGSDEGQLANLTAITFKVKNADDFIKVMTDNGVPAEAFEKVEKPNGNTDAQQQEQPQQPQQQAADMGGASMGAPQGGADMGGGMNPFESLLTRLTKNNKLNEEDETAANPFGDTDQPAQDSGVDPLNTETHDNNEEGEEVRLIDTSYASKVQQILNDVYGYSKDDFEKKIGGSIEDGEGESNDGSDDSFDENGQQSDEDAEKVGEEDTISPEDVFGDLDI